MAIKLADLTRETKAATFDYDGETCTVEYRPAAFTAKMQISVMGMSLLGKEGGDDAEKARHILETLGDYTEALTQLIAAWDILDDEGKALPVTVEIMQALPLQFVYAMFNAVMKSNNPNAKSAKS